LFAIARDRELKASLRSLGIDVQSIDGERPHEALGMKCPGEVDTPSVREYRGLPEVTYPFHDRDILVTSCGRICSHRKKINISIVFAGQTLGIKEVNEGIWLVSFMDYDLGYIDLEQRTLQPSATHSAQGCNPCIRYKPKTAPKPAVR